MSLSKFLDDTTVTAALGFIAGVLTQIIIDTMYDYWNRR